MTMIDTQAVTKSGADRYERIGGRVTHRNGGRPRGLTESRRPTDRDPETSGRVVLPVAAGAVPPDRSGGVRGVKEAYLKCLIVDPQCRRSGRDIAPGTETFIGRRPRDQ